MSEAAIREEFQRAWEKFGKNMDAAFANGGNAVLLSVANAGTIFRYIESLGGAPLAVSRPAPETEDVLDDMFAAGMGAHGKSIEEVAALLADAKLDAARALTERMTP